MERVRKRAEKEEEAYYNNQRRNGHGTSASNTQMEYEAYARKMER